MECIADKQAFDPSNAGAQKHVRLAKQCLARAEKDYEIDRRYLESVEAECEESEEDAQARIAAAWEVIRAAEAAEAQAAAAAAAAAR